MHQRTSQGAGNRDLSFPLVAAVFALVTGAALHAFEAVRPTGAIVWGIGLIIAGLPVIYGTLRGALRGRLAADLVASLAIVTAFLLGQPLVGLIVVIMQTGGEALERRARRRAADATRELEEMAPRIAHRFAGEQLEDIAVSEIRVGDLLLLRPGELAPCNGVVVEGQSHVDTSPLTGEPMPVRVMPGSPLRSGSINQEGALTIRAAARASESEYEQIVELVRTAHEHKAPIQRLADKYAVWFTPATVLVALLAYLASGDWTRVLAVLVVATPCPLILATPVAIIGGVNRAARRGIVLRHGTALEQLGGAGVMVLDKTGTITVGRPTVQRVVPASGFSEGDLLELAAAVEQSSSHVLARATVAAAHARGITIRRATNMRELAGRGVTGVVDGNEVAVGERSFVELLHPAAGSGFEQIGAARNGVARAYVAINRRAAGCIEYGDELREDLALMRRELEALGISRVVLLSGDTEEKTLQTAATAGIAEARGNLLPGDKAVLVAELVAEGNCVVMVGDGTNDAPALATATVGIALAGRGGIAAAAADVVIVANDLTRVTEAIRISRRTMRIAREGIAIGLGLSAIGMGLAAVGLLRPIGGALFQEVIDLLVIGNALRAAGGTRIGRAVVHPARAAATTLPRPARSRLRRRVGETLRRPYGVPRESSVG